MKTRMIITLAWLATIAPASHGQSQEGLTDQECFQIFPRADFSRPAKPLNGNPSWEAWRAARDEDAAELLGYVFLTNLAGEGAEKTLLIAVTPKMMIAGIKMRGADDLHEEFVAQFLGKSLRTKFEIAKTPTDLLFVPSKIKAHVDMPGLSESVVVGIKNLVAKISVDAELSLKEVD